LLNFTSLSFVDDDFAEFESKPALPR